MAPRLKVSGPIGQDLKGILRKRIKTAEDHLAADTGDLETAIHEARKELKASRSLARLIRHLVHKDDYRTLNSSLRKAGQTISGLRDVHALNGAVDLLVAESGLKTDAKKPLRKAVARMAETRAAAPGEDPATLIARARRHIAPLPKLVAGLDLPDEPEPYVEGLARCYREARKALKHGFDTRAAEDLHDARKRVINWRYQLDLVSPVWKPVLRAEVKELQALREHLGDHNDIAMLQHLLEANEEPWSRLADREAWIGRCEELRARLVDRARRSADLLFAERPKRHAGRIGTWWEVARRQ